MRRSVVIALTVVVLVAGILVGLTLLSKSTGQVEFPAGTAKLEALESTLTYLITGLYHIVIKLNGTLTYVHTVLLPELEKSVAIRDIEVAKTLLGRINRTLNTCMKTLSSFNNTYTRLRKKLPLQVRPVVDRYVSTILHSFIREITISHSEVTRLSDLVKMLSKSVTATILTVQVNATSVYPGQHVLIYGNLSDVYGHPLPNQRIELYAPYAHMYTMTDINGRFSFVLDIPINVTSKTITLSIIYAPPRDSNYGGSMKIVTIHVLPIPVTVQVENVSGVLCPGGWISFRLKVVPNMTVLWPYGVIRVVLGELTLSKVVTGSNTVSINLTLPRVKNLPRSALVLFTPGIATLSSSQVQINLSSLYRPYSEPKLRVSYPSIVLYPVARTVDVIIRLEKNSPYVLEVSYEGKLERYLYQGPIQVNLDLPLDVGLFMPYAVKEIKLHVIEEESCTVPVTYSLRVRIINVVPLLLVTLFMAVVILAARFMRRGRTTSLIVSVQSFISEEENIPTLLERTAKALGVRILRGFTVRDLARAIVSRIPALRSLMYSTVYVYEHVRFGLKRSEIDLLKALVNMLVNSLRSLFRRK